MIIMRGNFFSLHACFRLYVCTLLFVSDNKRTKLTIPQGVAVRRDGWYIGTFSEGKEKMYQC